MSPLSKSVVANDSWWGGSNPAEIDEWEYAGRSDVGGGFAVARSVSGFMGLASDRYQTGRAFARVAREVETRDVRDALTEGLLKATLTFRLDRGAQGRFRDGAKANTRATSQSPRSLIFDIVAISLSSTKSRGKKW
jgi:hypothetical protein